MTTASMLADLKAVSKFTQIATIVLFIAASVSACGGGSSMPDANDENNPDTPTPTLDGSDDNMDDTPTAPIDDDPAPGAEPEPEPEQEPPTVPESDPDPQTQPPEAAVALGFDDVDPALLPLTLTPLAPLTTQPAGVDPNNAAPYFENLTDQVIFAGQTMNLIISPKDPSGLVPGLFTSALPPDANYIDNFDGTKTISWRPLQPDVGVFTVQITAVDPEVPLYRTHQTIRIQVILPDDLSTIPNLPPAINGIEPSVVRAGDTVVFLVRTVDPNGTIGPLDALNPPTGSTFTQHPDEADTQILRWQTAVEDIGEHHLRFRTSDAIDPTMTAEQTMSVRVADVSEFDIPGERLRALADARNFKFGYASVLRWFYMPDADLYAATAIQDFNFVTTENSLKWGLVNPDVGVYRWDAADELVRFAKTNDLIVHGHPLVWHRQLPKWVQNLPIGERRNAMLKFIREVVNRYNNDILIWDVVNEAFEEDGTFRRSVWFEAMGEDYIASAFKQARLYSRNGELLYNDYDVAWENAKSDAMYALVTSLQQQNVPLDGVGFQMHLTTAFNEFDSVRRNFQRFADLGLDIYITELDVGMNSGDSLQRQADIYAEVLSICLEQPACQGYQIWGFTDRYSWRKETQPLIFDRSYQPKPAWFSLQQRLQGP